jgi:hypothetical protein
LGFQGVKVLLASSLRSGWSWGEMAFGTNRRWTAGGGPSFGLQVRLGRHDTLTGLKAAILRALDQLEGIGVVGAGNVHLYLRPVDEDGEQLRMIDGAGEPLDSWTPPRPRPGPGGNVVKLRKRG